MMHLTRAGASDINVADIVDIATAAGKEIMSVYAEDPEVKFLATWCLQRASNLQCRYGILETTLKTLVV